MKLYNVKTWKDRDIWCVIPTIVIHIDDPILMRHNIRIGIHWLIFNLGITFIDDEKRI